MSASNPNVVDPSTPTGALNILTQLADTYQGNWASHQAIRTALATVARLVTEHTQASPGQAGDRLTASESPTE
jgi:hypothetical protein